MKTLITEITVTPDNAELFDAAATTISLDDDAGGMFLKMKQCNDYGNNELRIDFSEWDTFCQVVELLKQRAKDFENDID